MGIHRLEIDGRWELLDIAQLVRPYVQVYSFFYALHPGLDEEDPNPRIIQVFQDYPRTGGWSSASFYSSLHRNTPVRFRPVPKSIHYSSPGVIEIGGVIAALWALNKVVNIACDTADRLERSYHLHHTRALERRILRANARRKEMQVNHREIEFAERAAEVMSEMLGIDQEELWKRTEDPISRMEITFSLYRRLKKLARFKQLGQLDFRSVKPDDKPKS